VYFVDEKLFIHESHETNQKKEEGTLKRELRAGSTLKRELRTTEKTIKKHLARGQGAF